MKRNIKGIMALAVLTVFGFSTVAFACWDRGYGNMMGPDGRRSGWHHRGGHGYGQEGYYGNLPELDQQRSEFFKATENIRQKLYEKELALRSELAKADPDTSKASSLQSEISKLQSELDQQRLDFEIQARKTTSNYNRDYRGYGSMMGHGPRGDGYCMW